VFIKLLANPGLTTHRKMGFVLLASAMPHIDYMSLHLKEIKAEDIDIDLHIE